jgi:hypothetical protein
MGKRRHKPNYIQIYGKISAAGKGVRAIVLASLAQRRVA